MVRLKVIEIAKPGEGAVSMAMQYAGVSDEGQKAILESCLVRAFDIVQKYANKALLPGRWRVTATDYAGEVKVYMGGTVEYVSGREGERIPFRQYGEAVVLSGDYAEVVFSTEVNEAEYDALLPAVLKYATALYDGEDAVVLNSILKECL